MRLPWQFFVTAGVIFISVKLLINLLVPIGVLLLIIGALFYFSNGDSPKVKVIDKK